MTTPLKPRRALAHPLWVAALVVLIANDHYLKTAGVLPGWLTGKLSDFAGLFVAPALLAALLSISTRRGILLAHAATGAVFAAIKISPAAARAIEALVGLTPFTWRVTVDPTDLIALPMLAASIFVLTPSMRDEALSALKGLRRAAVPGAAEPLAQRALLMVGSVACMATSQVEPPPCQSNQANCVAGGAPATGALILGNATGEQRLLRLRRLKTTVSVDCDALLADPSTALSRELFQPAESWLLEPNRALPLENSGDCAAFLVDADGLDMTLLAWSAADFSTTSVITALGSNGTSDSGASREIRMSIETDVGRVILEKHPVVFEAPPAEDPAPGAGCEVKPAQEGVDWSLPIPLGAHQITGVTTAPDGCTAVDFNDAPRFYLCVPEGTFPFAAGDSVELASWKPDAGASLSETGGEAVAAGGVSITSAQSAMIVARGNVVARWQSPDFKDYTVEVDPVVGCAGSHDECGSLVVPLEVSLFGGSAPDIAILRAGEKATLAPGAGALYLVRAAHAPILDTSCGAKGATARHFESVLVRKN